ncbi:hypothetical protein CP970_43935 [Streptomyces kanamyceticus]|uniref:RacP protein n=1 Tax=Streptomyces kanamyceticus TaxID=1967 RepID=A0A5J6GVB4_STRKN|nr:hypothetical protein CP970_43935 [Streptomyces kanamyceticus]
MRESTGRTVSQVRSGINFLRKSAAKWGLPPVTWSRTTGWQLSEDPAVWIAFERILFNAEMRHITRAIDEVMTPHAKRAPGDDFVRLVLDQLGGIRASLEVIIRIER